MSFVQALDLNFLIRFLPNLHYFNHQDHKQVNYLNQMVIIMLVEVVVVVFCFNFIVLKLIHNQMERILVHQVILIYSHTTNHFNMLLILKFFILCQMSNMITNWFSLRYYCFTLNFIYFALKIHCFLIFHQTIYLTDAISFPHPMLLFFRHFFIAKNHEIFIIVIMIVVE